VIGGDEDVGRIGQLQFGQRLSGSRKIVVGVPDRSQ
jgi:hypothetical protein